MSLTTTRVNSSNERALWDLPCSEAVLTPCGGRPLLEAASDGSLCNFFANGDLMQRQGKQGAAQRALLPGT